MSCARKLRETGSKQCRDYRSSYDGLAFEVHQPDATTTTFAITIMVPTRGGTAGGGISAKYSRLADRAEGYIDMQFKRSPPNVPYKAIALAMFLFLVGSLLIIAGSLLLTGYIHVTYPDRTVPVLIIGVLIFLPGFYHLRIAYYASRGYRGYSYEDIPDFDE